VKTIGHVHNAAPDGLGYPEAYEVVAGAAVFLLFREHGPGTQSLLVDAAAGDRFVIPPGWHHLAINPGDQAMVFADVVARAVVPDYSLLRARRGGPVYLETAGLPLNAHFAAGPVARLRASELPFPDAHTGLADAFLRDRRALDYLLRPAAFASLWGRFDAAVAHAPPQEP
jgi:glucose-6-phosphate isomerase